MKKVLLFLFLFPTLSHAQQPVTTADGAQTTVGAKADAKSTATDTTPTSIVSILKEISALQQAPASRAVTNAGTFAVQAAQSGTWTVTGAGGTFPVTGTFWQATQPVSGSGVFEVGPTTGANTLSNQFFTQLSDGTHGQTFMSTTTSSKYGADMNILSILGTAPTTAGFIDVKGADGNVFVRQTTGSNLHVQADSGSTTAVTGIVEVAPTGSANTLSNPFFNETSDGTNTALVDPCKSVAKVYTVISQAAAGPTTLVAGTSAKKTYICSIVILPVTAAISMNLVEGTGTNCSSVSAGVWGGTTAASGAVIAINGGFVSGNGDSAIAQTATNADNLCIIASGTTQISGGMYTVQR